MFCTKNLNTRYANEERQRVACPEEPRVNWRRNEAAAAAATAGEPIFLSRSRNHHLPRCCCCCCWCCSLLLLYRGWVGLVDAFTARIRPGVSAPRFSFFLPPLACACFASTLYTLLFRFFCLSDSTSTTASLDSTASHLLVSGKDRAALL
ncbi:hypothetical protein GQ54DRAFT_97801 [Martensiomyces pterosporus]|nr:hypothetical protein GQ54DRAFT_97801 [Martensiomyces pterosporus]